MYLRFESFFYGLNHLYLLFGGLFFFFRIFPDFPIVNQTVYYSMYGIYGLGHFLFTVKASNVVRIFAGISPEFCRISKSVKFLQSYYDFVFMVMVRNFGGTLPELSTVNRNGPTIYNLIYGIYGIYGFLFTVDHPAMSKSHPEFRP